MFLTDEEFFKLNTTLTELLRPLANFLLTKVGHNLKQLQTLETALATASKEPQPLIQS